MPVAVNQPQRREEKDPLDTILKGLQIAQGVYGIKADSEKQKLQAAKDLRDEDNAQFQRAAGQASLLKAGFEAKKQDDGTYLTVPRVGFQDLETEKTKSEIAKNYADAKRKGAEEGGLAFELKRLQVEKAKRELSRDKGEKEAFESLPKESQIEVEGLTKKVVDRRQIQNDINAALTQLEDPDLDENQKIAIGGELLKTLNSSQGADAIGSEEAKRLGAKLEYSYGNFLNSNPTQFGRDLPGFIEQVKNNSARLGKSIEASQARVGELRGRPAVPPDMQKAAQQELIRRRGLNAAKMPGK